MRRSILTLLALPLVTLAQEPLAVNPSPHVRVETSDGPRRTLPQGIEGIITITLKRETPLAVGDILYVASERVAVTDIRSDGDDTPGPFVTEHDREGVASCTGHHLEVAVAHPRRSHLDDHLVRRGPSVERDIVAQVQAALAEHECPHRTEQ